MDEFGIQYNKEEWRLFIDLFKTTLKAVLLHNDNMYAYASIRHFVHKTKAMKPRNSVKYSSSSHSWMTCSNLNVTCSLLRKVVLSNLHVSCVDETVALVGKIGSKRMTCEGVFKI